MTARTTSTTSDCLSSQAEDGIRSAAVTVAQTCALPICAPLGMVSFVVSTSPSGSSSAVAPNPCTLTPGTTSSTCLVTFTANTLGSYTITATYNPAPTSEDHTSELHSPPHLASRPPPAKIDCQASPPPNIPLSCTLTVAATNTAPNVFFFNDTATTEISTLSLPDALPISNPCTLTPGTTSSTCLVTFTANTLGSYTITATYNPAP